MRIEDMGLRARPFVVAGFLDDSGAHWVAFDVTDGVKEIGLIQQKTTESALPEIAAPLITLIDCLRGPAMSFADRFGQAVLRFGLGGRGCPSGNRGMGT